MQDIDTDPGSNAIVITLTDPRSAAALHCLQSYYHELDRRFARGFDVNLSHDPEAADMMAPRGAFFVARRGGNAVGCVGLKGGGAHADIKRLWVSPEARRQGLARMLMKAAETEAGALGYHCLRLDTNSALPEARALYLATGWRPIGRYNDDPYPDLFFEKTLR